MSAPRPPHPIDMTCPSCGAALRWRACHACDGHGVVVVSALDQEEPIEGEVGVLTAREFIQHLTGRVTRDRYRECGACDGAGGRWTHPVLGDGDR